MSSRGASDISNKVLPPKDAPSWTSEEDERLLAGKALGLSLREISERFLPGRSGAAAAIRYDRLTKAGVDIHAALPSNDAVHRAMCEQGSHDLLKAYHRYYEKHVAGRAA